MPGPDAPPGAPAPKQKKASFVVSVVCGGVAGSAAKTVTAPLERLRILRQVGAGGPPLDALRAVLEREGPAGLWAGNLANLARIFPARGIAFSTNDAVRSRFEVRTTAGGFAAGASAGLAATALTYPLDMIRGRQAGRVQTATTAKKPNFARALVAVWRTEGVAALYRGSAPTLIGSMPFEGIRFGVVEALSQRRRKKSRAESPPTAVVPPPQRRRSWTKAVDGGIAGAVAGVLTFPNDTIRRIMQTGDRGIGYFECAADILRTHGWRRFYFGLGPNLVRAVPSAAIQFGVFDWLKTRASTW